MKSSEVKDPLLECLVILTRLNHHPLSPESLTAGLPLEDNQLTPHIFIRAAERAGLASEIFKRPLKKIHNLILPAVLLLKDNQACILNYIYDDETVDIIFPEKSEDIVHMPMSEILEVYTNQMILVHPIFKFEKHTEITPETLGSGSWFWNTLWHYRYTYLQVVIGAVLINLFSLASPLFVMNVYDRVVPNNATTTLWVLTIGVLIIFIFDFIIRNLRGYLIDVSGKKADILLSSALFQQVLGMELKNKPASVGAFVSNLREFEVLRDFFTSATLTTIVDLPFILFFFIFIWYIGGIVVLVPLVIVPLTLLIIFFLEKPLRKTVFLALQGSVQKHSILVESVTGLETLKCLRAEGQLQGKWEKTVGTTALLSMKARFLSSLVVNLVNFAQQAVTIGVIVLGVYVIHAGNLTLGGLIACSILAGRILAPLSSLANLLTRFQQSKMALKNLSGLMEMSLERPANKYFIHQSKLKGNIEFNNVSFQYPGTQMLAIDKLSFKIAANERVAFIGRIGSGKSTIQKLILNLYQPQSGQILIDGIDIKQIDPIDLRRNIGYVSQDSLLFFGSVRDNIAMSRPTADDIDIMRAGQLSGVDTFVHRHPEGYDMPVGERGEGLSGGQRQSIAIARALLHDPTLLLFDEPTSAMDNSSEVELIQRLAPRLDGKTLVLVTHRSTLFPLVNRLLVMDTGRLVADGPKDKILNLLIPSGNGSGSKDKS